MFFTVLVSTPVLYVQVLYVQAMYVEVIGCLSKVVGMTDKTGASSAILLIKYFRRQNKVPVLFTYDGRRMAGPQVTNATEFGISMLLRR